MTPTKKRIVAVGTILFALAIGSGRLYCEDYFQEVPLGKCGVGETRVSFFMDPSIYWVHEETLWSDLTRTKETHCGAVIYAFNSIYTSYRVKRMVITVEGTSALTLMYPSAGDFAHIDMWFRPYDGRPPFSSDFPRRVPRIGTFELDPRINKAPLLTCSPTINSHFHIELDLDILSANQIVASGTAQTDFVLRRRKRWIPWLAQCLGRAIMPNF